MHKNKSTDQYPWWTGMLKLNKISLNQIQEHIKNTTYHNQIGFISEVQGYFNVCKSVNIIYHINRLKDRNHMIIALCSEKIFQDIL